MSHELRTPLNAVIGFSEMLSDGLIGTLTEKQRECVNHIFQSGHHLLLLINDILDLSKVEAGKMDLQISRIRLEIVLRNCMILIKEKAIKHSLQLELKMQDDLREVEICADEVKLKQIIFNLLSNAAKFTPGSGRITLSAIRDNGNLLVSVTDTGIGIKLEDQPRIFEAFEQVDSSYSRQQEGTGLGLALTQRLVELHGGRIWVQSDGEGKGSTFSFVIPYDLGDVDAADGAGTAFQPEDFFKRSLPPTCQMET